MSRAKALKDLKRSGLTATDFKKLKLEVLTAKQNEKLTTHDVAGYKIPYFDLNGKPIKNGWRVRHLEEIKGKFNSTLKKPIRYTGPAGELPHLYFPQGHIDWPAVAKDVHEPVYITEGEKKAATMCKAGLPCIAVPGVWGWRAKKKNVDLLIEFDWFEWKGDEDQGRPLCLVFDNDLNTNEDVIIALNAFARKMFNDKGASVFIRYLPPGPLKGVDDFIVENGIDAFLEIDGCVFETDQHIAELNERLAYVENEAFVYDFETKRNYNSAAKLEFAFSNRIHFVPKADGDGDKPVKTVKTWSEWKHRRTYDGLTYEPGQDEVVNGKVNIWKRYACEPVKGNVKPFIELIDFVFANAEPHVKKWFLQWLAYPLQHPGTKLYSSVLLWSQYGGVGKSFIGLIMKRIYGDNFSEVTKEEITSDFNSWRIGKQFILGDEITGNDSKREADKIKGLITAEHFNANLKNQGNYQLRSLENYLLTSNHGNALFLQGHDRRFLVHNIPTKPTDAKFYDRVDEWKESDAGPSALFHYLLHEVDCKTFNPRRAPPATQDKEEMLEASKSNAQVEFEDMIANPDMYFKKVGVERDVFTSQELFNHLHNQTHTSPQHLGGLATAPLQLPKKSVRVKLPMPGARRLIAVRNINKWRNAEPKAWADNYEKDFQEPKYAKGKKK